MNNKILGHKALRLLAAAIIIAAFSSTAFSQQTEQGYALIIQQSPADAGRVTPNVGVHRPQMNEIVTIQAIPKPGYRFIYWMGDVLNPTANRTTVSIDAPKLIIAVFEREEFELLSRSNASTGGSQRGGAVRKPGETPNGDIANAPIEYDPPYYPPYYPPDEPRVVEDDFSIPVPGGSDEVLVPGGSTEVPVPGEGNDIPVPGDGDPIPEPATMLMLAAGTMFLRKRHHKQKQK